MEECKARRQVNKLNRCAYKSDLFQKSCYSRYETPSKIFMRQISQTVKWAQEVTDLPPDEIAIRNGTVPMYCFLQEFAVEKPLCMEAYQFVFLLLHVEEKLLKKVLNSCFDRRDKEERV